MWPLVAFSELATLEPIVSHHSLSMAGACPIHVREAVSGSRVALCTPECYTNRGSLQMAKRIIQAEGLVGLWRGTTASLAMAVPLVGIYMPLYDMLMEQCEPTFGLQAPLLAGSVARGASVYCTAPLELLRTRVQGMMHPNKSKAPEGTTVVSTVPRSARHFPRAVRSQFTGVNATLARDVPFSALYWWLLEQIRRAALPEDGELKSTGRVLLANIYAGGTAGSIAATLTTPLDVIKTRIQLAPTRGTGSNTHTVFGTFRSIMHTEGLSGLFAGVVPRATRAVPSCAIVVGTYEVLKNKLTG